MRSSIDLETLKQKVSKHSDLKAEEAILRIESEQTVEQVKSLIQAARTGESDAIKPSAHRILDGSCYRSS